MTIDTSALVSILFEESGYLDLVDKILSADQARVAAPTLVEASLVVEGNRRRMREKGDRVRAAPMSADIEALVKELHITVVPFGEPEWRAAMAANLRFGRGPAALNFGDCLSYAAASVAGDSLLFVGDDFKSTDILPA